LFILMQESREHQWKFPLLNRKEQR
jgi:hypothetical protein